MAFDWFNATEAHAFGESLAELILKKMPPASESSKSLSPKKKEELLSNLFSQAERFRANHKLNIYKKAKLGNAFKWKMRDLGYDEAFTNELTHQLMARL